MVMVQMVVRAVAHQDTLMEIREEMVQEQQGKEMLAAQVWVNIIRVAAVAQVQPVPMVAHLMAVPVCLITF
jgi:hypothetical protein